VSASKDQNSISVMPPFVSESDLHLVGGSTLINNGGKALEKVTTDIDGNVRNTTTPDLGADEIVPAINVSATKLDGYSYEEGKGPSAEQSFKVSGSTLVGDITVTPSTNYELLVPNGDSYDVINSIVLTQTNGVVKDSSVFVRLKAGLSKGDYNAEKVIISTNEATAKNVICNGTVLFGTLLESISKEKALNLYPNPAISDVTISSDRQVQYVELIDMDGRVSKRIDAGFTNNINISDLSAGLYLVRVKTNEGFKYGKLTVK